MWWHVFWKEIEVNVWALTTIFKNTSLICGCHFCFRIQPDIDRIHLQTLSLIHFFKEQYPLNINTDGLSDGLYLYDLTIETNDYENSLITIPINLNILEGVCSEWSAGDLNQDNDLNILDVVLLINFVLEDNYTSSGDINNDETLNILDIVQLVNIILNL